MRSADQAASRITVNLAPADLPKEGSHYDLPIALGLMAASVRILVISKTDQRSGMRPRRAQWVRGFEITAGSSRRSGREAFHLPSAQERMRRASLVDLLGALSDPAARQRPGHEQRPHD
jgi:Subunit ChlI of Mg-chelatase